MSSQVATAAAEEEAKERHGAPSPGSFSNRRQKNLQKFRKHLKTQRQTSDSTNKGGAVLNVSVAETPSADNDPEQTVSEDGNQGDSYSLSTTSTSTGGGTDKVNNKSVVDNDVKPPPPPQQQDNISVESADKKDSSASEAPAPKSPVPTAGKPPQLATSGGAAVEQQQNSASHHHVAAMSPQTSKRRADIIKKFAKKNRHPSHGEKSPMKEHDESKEEEGRSNSPPLMPLMNNNKATTSSTTAVNCGSNKPHDAPRNNKTTKPPPTDLQQSNSENNENAVDEKVIGENIQGAELSDKLLVEEKGVDMNNKAMENNDDEKKPHNEGSNNNDNAVDAQSCEASRSFDLRSIHDFPTKPIEEATASLPSKDPSWDAAKVIFSEYQKPASARSPTSSDAIDVFDTSNPADWEATNENSFSEVFDPENPDLTSNSAPRETEESPESPASNESPRRKLSRLQVSTTSSTQVNTFGFDISNLATDSTDALDHAKSKEEPDKASSHGDDDDLLAGNNGVDDDSDENMWINESQPSKEERLQQYTSTAPHGDDSSAASSSNEELNDESSRFSEDAPDIEYMPQAEEEMEEEKKEAEEMQPRAEFDNMPPHIVNADAAPTFVLAAEAAAASEGPHQQDTGAAEAGTVDGVNASSSAGAEANPSDPMESFSASHSADSNNSEVGYISNSSSPSSSSSNSADASKPASAGDNGGVDQGPDDEDEPGDLEESTSLVGVSLVPSFGATSKGLLPSVQVKARDGMPPRGNLSPLTMPPPPPPPLSKRKKRKKKKDKTKTKKDVPCIAPPPEEKLKKWLDSKERAVRTVSPREATGDSSAAAPSTFQQTQEEVTPSYEAFSEKKEAWEEAAESPGSIHISCGGYSTEDMTWGSALPEQLKLRADHLTCATFGGEQGDATTPRLLGESGHNGCVNGISDALAIAGLNVAAAKGCLSSREEGPTPSSVAPSPVDAARSIALENAMKRANQGSASSRFDFSATARNYLDSKACNSLFESDAEVGASTSMGSNSLEESNSGPTVTSKEPSTVDEPPQLVRKDLHGAMEQTTSEPPEKAIAFLETLMSPSMSMSPSNNGQNPDSDGVKGVSQSALSSAIIHDTKMAEKAAMASHAAAVTFEEQYYAAKSGQVSHSRECGEQEDKNDLQSLFCAQEIGENLQNMADGGEEAAKLFFGQNSGQSSKDNLTEIIGEKRGVLQNFVLNSPSRDDQTGVQDLAGGAFSPWKNSVYARKPSPTGSVDCPGSVTIPASSSSCLSERSSELLQAHRWLTQNVLHCGKQELLEDSAAAADAVRESMTRLLNVDDNFNKLCIFIADTVNIKINRENEERAMRNAPLSPRKKIKPFILGPISGQKCSAVVAANFVSFIHRISKTAEEPSPFGEDNPFLLDLVGTSIHGTPIGADPTKMQKIVFSRCAVEDIVAFCARVCGGPDSAAAAGAPDAEGLGGSSFDLIEATRAANPSPTKKSKNNFFDDRSPSSESALPGERKWIVPDSHPSPFEFLVEHESKILAVILGFLGDPVAVCRMKMTSKNCQQYVRKNEQVLMRDAVRLGGLSMHVRPSFWLWVILEKCNEAKNDVIGDNQDQLLSIEEAGRAGKYHHVIQRDVARAFGNMPPHKTGSRLRTDSIVRALVSWGRNRIMKRGVKGDTPPSSGRTQYESESESEASQTRAETVSDWGGVSPVASFAGSCNGEERGTKNDEGKKRRSQDSQSVSTDLLVLGGNALTDDMKADLQNKLSFILHALAATHFEVGYCQGMDYVVAHLLRVLQETICWRATNGTLPASIVSAPKLIVAGAGTDTAKAASEPMVDIDTTLVVEETIYRVMDCLFTTFNLQHMYWPELRCLKTCCRVFERLIQIKLPVLADHFEHHELNVGLFALGWFQTLFLYLPSMPTATVCHIWDIWLVERSFKIFFRVGTAILFLSQPILLNHELEGMMTYLNTFPDATLLNPDILIACALQIKVTNKLLQDIEEQVMSK